MQRHIHCALAQLIAAQIRFSKFKFFSLLFFYGAVLIGDASLWPDCLSHGPCSSVQCALCFVTVFLKVEKASRKVTTIFLVAYKGLPSLLFGLFFLIAMPERKTQIKLNLFLDNFFVICRLILSRRKNWICCEKNQQFFVLAVSLSPIVWYYSEEKQKCSHRTIIFQLNLFCMKQLI